MPCQQRPINSASIVANTGQIFSQSNSGYLLLCTLRMGMPPACRLSSFNTSTLKQLMSGGSKQKTPVYQLSPDHTQRQGQSARSQSCHGSLLAAAAKRDVGSERLGPTHFAEAQPPLAAARCSGSGRPACISRLACFLATAARGCADILRTVVHRPRGS